MKITELLTRACDDTPADQYRIVFGRALAIAVRKWLNVRHFSEDHLRELKAELEGL